MSIFVNKNSRVVVQGMTGHEGMRHTARMLAAGTTIVAGVNPRKAGAIVHFDNVNKDIPVFGTVKEAMAATGANVSVVFVPAFHAKSAMIEAIDAEIPVLVTITEGIPVHDAAVAWAHNVNHGQKTRIIGPNCPGIITPEETNIGIIPDGISSSGPIGLVPTDFIAVAQPLDDLPTADGTGSMHDLLMSNFFAQTKVLAFGKTAAEIAAEGTPAELVNHKVMPGNRPSTSILATRLTPEVVGSLIALYEHIVFVQGMIYSVNPYDQWGVELGKKQAGDLLPFITGDTAVPSVSTTDAGVTPSGMDSSTAALISRYRSLRADARK